MADLVLVFSGPSVKAGMIQSLLEAEGLTAVLHDQHMAVLKPWIAVGASVGSAKVLVPRLEAQEALEIIAAAGL